MRVYQRIEALFAPSADVWERHSNPLSGWTRVPILPLLALAIYARLWIGWWCFLPIALLVLWAFVNPRAFPPPKDRSAWMTSAAYGERIWLNQKTDPIPAHHAKALKVLAPLPLLGTPALFWGLYSLDAALSAVSVGFVVITKMWFLDRMVWLYEETPKDARP
ncbi:MAG: DUF6653 family protein [Pseudomonadota bacterium]